MACHCSSRCAAWTQGCDGCSLCRQVITALHEVPDARGRLLAALACLQGLLGCKEGLQACFTSPDTSAVANASVVLAAQLDVCESERSRVALAMLRRLAGDRDRGYAQVVAALLEEASSASQVFVDAPEHLYYVPQRLLAFLDLFQVSRRHVYCTCTMVVMQAEDGLVSVDLELIEAALALLVDLVAPGGAPAIRRQCVTACMQAGVVRVLFELHQLRHQEIDR